MNYFELYYSYLAQCEKENWANMRDPNHDYMEWNHTLPQCIFGDQPIGQWLTIEQHAIASALQTLAFNAKCICGWHKKFIPQNLWEVCIVYYRGKHNNWVGRSHSQGTKERISESKLGKPLGPQSDTHRSNLSQSLKQNYVLPEWTKELRAKHSEAFSGKGNPRFGSVLSSETKSRISIKKKERFRCLVTGIESNDGGLTKIQNRLGIDPSNRIQIN